MNNFFNNLIKKITPKKDSEKKAKEEEDPTVGAELVFEVVKQAPDNELDKNVAPIEVDSESAKK